jgi:hypothetical protein
MRAGGVAAWMSLSKICHAEFLPIRQAAQA